MPELEPVIIGGHVVAYKPAPKAAKKTTAKPAEDKKQAAKPAETQKES